MSPTVRSGDRLLVRRVRPPDAVRPGRRRARPLPRPPDLLVVKRVRRAVPGGHWVEGDNPFGTDDSRAYGVAVVVGRVVARAGPARVGCPPRAEHRGICGPLRSRVHGRQPGFRARARRPLRRRPAFAVHEGGKLSVTPTRSIDLHRRPRADLHARRRPGLQRHRRRAASSPAASPGRPARSPSSPTAPPVLGLGNIGPAASLPVMEGKACLFTEFAGLPARPDHPVDHDVDHDRRDRRRHRPLLRRHQPRGHQRAAVLRDRGAAARAARHPGHA